MTDYIPRQSQSQILAYRGGYLGISAVPGSGKTHTLSALAADLITRGALEPDQEVLIVTLVNSAVDNFTQRISAFIQEHGLIPRLGYRVRTLHGLAHDIVREKPTRVGLDEHFNIIDEQEANRIRSEAVHAWLQGNPDVLTEFLDPNLEDSKRDWVRRQQLPDLVDSLALAFIRSAKDHRVSPGNLDAIINRTPYPLPLAIMGSEIYSYYQRALQYRGAVDFDDLIRLSLDLLSSDPEYLERLHYRFPFILEDEAQDSSELQEQILGLMVGEQGNWVRVGDPNQAIFETFTTASPELMRRFIAGHPHIDMAESGRSQPAIIALANQLIEWTMNNHPDPDARSALTPPYIKPTSKGDPQQNPPERLAAIQFIDRKLTPQVELEWIANSIEEWLPAHQDRTVAVLVPRNQRGAELIDVLKKKGVKTIELLASTSDTRLAAGAMSHMLAYLADPQSSQKLAKVYQVWRRDWRRKGEFLSIYNRVTRLLRKCKRVEAFLAPFPGTDWFDTLPHLREEENESDELISITRTELDQFRILVRRWLEAVMLPIDQLILTLSAEIFTEPADLALAHKLALIVRQSSETHRDWRLPELTEELAVIARNERRFIGFSSDDSGFDPTIHRGAVVVTTMHKAKGLEWDRVYLMSVNDYDFPSNQPSDQFIAEKWFVRAKLNLEAEALAQLKTALAWEEYQGYVEGDATIMARKDYVRERLRLLFVAITRAREELILTYNTGRQGESKPAVAFSALQGWLENQELKGMGVL